MRPINLHSLTNAYSNMNEEEFSQYKSFYNIKPKNSELEDLKILIPALEKNSLQNFNSFYFGYSIEQISSEFDLLRFGSNKIINIELKRESTQEEILQQLIRNRHYLGILEKELFTYTYISSEEKVYKLDNENKFNECTIMEIIYELNSQDIIEYKDISSLFEPSKYLVSPFNSPQKFLEGKYFLNENQSSFKKDIMEIFDRNENQFIGVKGDAGTGKTLLTYDIAKTLSEHGKEVLIIFCANLNSGHHYLNRKGWNVKSIREFDDFIGTLDRYDYIIMDEVQRVYLEQFDAISNAIIEKNLKCIYSYDPKQCFSNYEFKRNIPERIENVYNAKLFPLSKKIRTNKELTSFVTNLFDLSKINNNMKYEHINIHYFTDIHAAKKLIAFYENEEWEVINFTGSHFNRLSYEEYQFRHNYNVHGIIGQEFDKVLGVIDQNFYYDSSRLLTSRPIPKSPGYDLDKMLYQILTRARQEITLVIINNKSLLQNSLKILGYPLR